MELNNNLENIITKDNKTIEKNQTEFLQSNLWRVINAGLNTGIRMILPDLIENQIIEIKDAIIKSGFKEGAKQAVSSAIDIGKSTIGIFTGNFESISQAQNAIKSGGIIDSISTILDYAIDKSINNRFISSDIGKIIKKGKNVIINSIESNIENNYNNQQNSIEKISKYSDNWKEYYKNKDFKGMEKEYNKIEDTMKKVLPIEKTIKQVREIENIHLLIKNNGHNFNLTKEQLELSKILIS